MFRLVFVLGALLSCEAQLRPRRVGVDPLGESEPAADAAGGDLEAKLAKLREMAAGGGADADPAAQMAMLQELMGGGEGGHAAELGKMMAGAGKDFAQAMAANMKEAASLLENPDALQEKLSELMGGDGEGANLMQEMQSVLTDPDKLREGIAAMASNPMFAQMADAVPGLKQAFADPEALEQGIAHVTNAFAQMQDEEGQLDVGKMAEMMQQSMGAMGSMFEGMDAEGVQEKLAEMMGGGGLGGPGAGSLDDFGTADSENDEF